jgi:UDP-GlcNAc3NAcA epimerase
LKLLTCIGARPQIIKAAAVNRAIKNYFSDRIREVVVHTGQHYDESMSGIFFNELGSTNEKYNLNAGSSSHAHQTAQILTGLEEIVLKEKPDAVLVYGDTNSTIAGGLVASKLHIPVVHIEAGMRSFNKSMPEEINRICCDHVSTLLFTPTKTGFDNLIREGFKENAMPPYSADNPKIYHAGDIMYDNSIYFKTMAEKKSKILVQNELEKNRFVLVTIHRESNTDSIKNLNNLFSAFHDISQQEKIKFILPLHPRTKKMLNQNLETKLYSAIQNNRLLKIIDPVSFLDMIVLESFSCLVMTDSGGVQKESYFFKKPCIILRNETEWVELTAKGTAVLCGTDKEKIFNAWQQFKISPPLNFPNIFGDGKAAEFICSEIINHIKPA